MIRLSFAAASVVRGLGLAVLVLTAPVAAAQTPLFAPASPARLSATAAERLDALVRAPTAAEVALVQADPAALAAGGDVALDLPGVSSVVLSPDRVEARAATDVSWAGSSATAEGLFVVRGGRVTGIVQTAEGRFQVRPFGPALHTVTRLDEAALPDNSHGAAYDDVLRQSDVLGDAAHSGAPALRGPDARTPAATPAVGVVVAYTPSAREEADLAVAGDGSSVAAIETQAQLAIDQTNAAFANSGVLARVALVHTFETAADNSPSEAASPYGTDLNDFRIDGDGRFDEIHAARTAHGGDLAALLSAARPRGGAEDDIVGLAYVPASVATAFSVSHWDFATSVATFAHELGHNFGANHNTEIAPQLRPFSYGHGAISATGDWFTIMSYSSSCSGPCARLTAFSAPAVLEGGEPIGDETLRNVARVIDERANELAGFVGPAVSSAVSVSGGPLAVTLDAGAATTRTVAIANVSGGVLSWVSGARQFDGATGTAGYTLSTSADAAGPTAAFEDISATGTALSFTDASCGTVRGPDDDGWATVPTPTGFAFFGAPVTTLRVSPNGVIEVDGMELCAPNPSELPSARLPNGLIAPYWVDQVVADIGGIEGAVYVQTDGDPGLGTERTVVQWDAVYRYDATEVSDYQVVLEQDGTITFQYGDMEYSGVGTGSSAGVTVGIESGDGTAAVPVDYLSGVVTDNLAVRFEPSARWLRAGGYGFQEQGGPVGAPTVTLDAADLPAGTYAGEVTVSTNDPARPFTTVPVTLTVEAPTLALQDGAGWRILSAPYDGVTVGWLAGQNLVQGTPDSYPTAGANLLTGYDGTAWEAAGIGATSIHPGEGFAWYFYDETFDPPDGAFGGGSSESVALPLLLSATGSELTTDADLALHADGDTWNLLGNPFALDVDVSGSAAWSGGDLLNSDGQVWQCTPNGATPVQCVGSYATLTMLGDVLPAWHGVFFETTAPGTLTVPYAARITSARRSSPRLIGFELAAADGSALDRAAALVFREGAGAGWDRWDASKLASLASPSVQIALVGERDGESVLKAQESRALDPASFEVPVHVASAGAGGSLVLTWPRVEHVPAGWVLTLLDHETGATLDLRAADRYAFEVAETAGRTVPAPGATARASGGDDPRFTVRIQTQGAVADEDAAAAATWLSPPTPNPARTGARVAYRVATAGRVRLSVVDLLGREVAVLTDAERSAGAGQAALPVGRLAPGVYVIRLEADGRVLTRRAVVAR